MPGGRATGQRFVHAVERFGVLDWKKTLAEVYASF